MPEQPEPTLSVVIAARDAARFLGAALDSLAGQTRLPAQVVVYDDGSSDGTAGLARAHAGRLPGLTVIEGPTPAGISAARNRANAAASGDYIAVLDADDMFAPDAVESYLDFLSKHPGADLVYADTRVCDVALRLGKTLRYPRFRDARDAIRRTLGSPLVPFKHSSMVYRASAFRAAGGYDETLSIKVDIDLFLRFHSLGMEVAKLDHATSVHRKHRGQVSAKRLRGIAAFRRIAAAYEPDPLVRGALLAARVPAECLKMLLRG